MQTGHKDVLDQERAAEQWQAFVEHGILLDGVDPVIADSWTRSRSYGVDPYDPLMEHISPKALEKLQQENMDMLRLAKPLMDKLLFLAKDTVHAMTLHDKNGYMLTIVSNTERKTSWMETAFRPGVRWTEENVGTNGVGLVLRLDRPVQIIGPQHYCYLQRGITCSAAPIHNADGELVGILNISGPISVDTHLLVLVAYGAYSIESQMHLDYSHRFMSKMMDVISQGLILFDSHFNVIRCSRYAAKMFKTAPASIVGLNVVDILNTPDIPEKITSTKRSYSIQEQACTAADCTVMCNIDIMPMMNRSDFIGGVLHLQESKNMNKIANLYSGNYARYTFEDIITSDVNMGRLIENMRLAAETDYSILIEGESGTGKELFAHAIHSYSSRRNEPFIAINCASLPRSLVESELFGYEKGSFSGALSSGSPGKFELANGGSIFLDEIGELPLEMQSKLLRVLDTHRVSRIGGRQEKELDIRIIAATNRDLLEEVEKQNFRQDLYYRLNMFRFYVPPLRDRMGDLDPLVHAFVDRQNQKDAQSKQASPALMDLLQRYSWPGNVRELQNVVIRAYYCCPEQTILPEHAGSFGSFGQSRLTTPLRSVPQPTPVLAADPSLSAEREKLLALIAQHGGDLLQTAQALHISRATMYRRLKKLQIDPKSL